jgi:hypothetical protein
MVQRLVCQHGFRASVHSWQRTGLRESELAGGLTAAVASTRLLTTMLFRMRRNDPHVYLAVAVLLGLMALFATLFSQGVHAKSIR